MRTPMIEALTAAHSRLVPRPGPTHLHLVSSTARDVGSGRPDAARLAAVPAPDAQRPHLQAVRS